MPVKLWLNVLKCFTRIQSPILNRHCPSNFVHHSQFASCKNKFEVDDPREEYDGHEFPGLSSVDPIDIAEHEESLDLVSPAVTPTYTFAKHVNSSVVLKELVKLGVNLSRVEKFNRDMIRPILGMEFDNDIKPYIEFLVAKNVPISSVGNIFTKAPDILIQDIQDMEVRIDFLKSRGFNDMNVCLITQKNPRWICKMISEIGAQLNYFKDYYHMKNSELNNVMLAMPKLLTHNKWNLKFTAFAFEEEMGYNRLETGEILKQCPKLWIISRRALLERFDFVHNQLQASHEQIKSHPGVLTCRVSKMKERHAFLRFLGKDQYDPSKPNYVSSRDIICRNDSVFCRIVAGVGINIYNDFLKTL